MPVDHKRSILGELKKPLIHSDSGIPAGLEQRLLGNDGESAKDGGQSPVAETPTTHPDTSQRTHRRTSKHFVPTVAVTFHLPVDLRDKVKLTAQAKQKTMLEIAIDALTEYLSKNPVSEADLRKLLGL